jgi:hypothetical protein
LVADCPDDLDSDCGSVLYALCVLTAAGEGEFNEGEGFSRGLEQRNLAVAVPAGVEERGNDLSHDRLT